MDAQAGLRLFFLQTAEDRFSHDKAHIKSTIGAPQGFWGSGENSHLFSGSWGALVIILGELGSKLIILGI